MKILGFDLGSNSIGWAIRDTLNEGNQIEKFGVSIFEKGVGIGKTGEFSFAAERTKNRSVRRLYQARKYRIWNTLKVLRNHGMCPITEDELNQWMCYDKKKGLKRMYPVQAHAFEQWIKLDFDGDGKPDYKSPYELRAIIATKKLDLNQPENKFKIGRALYHIAQRRGFKSSRKDAQLNEETGEKKDAKSEEKKDKAFYEKLQSQFGKTKDEFLTIGCALAYIESQGKRVRNEWIQYTYRKHYKEEAAFILQKQGFSETDSLYVELIETKLNRYDGAIFFQRPLRSQKGLVGLCTLEQRFFKDPKTGKKIATGKPRCPISHPAFEEFRALQFINNIQVDKQPINQELRNIIYQKLFFRISKQHFKFEEIRELIEKNIARKLSYRDKSINYSDKTNVSGCPVSARFVEIFGENWRNINIETKEFRKNKKGAEHSVKYSIEDIWHILFSYNDEEAVHEFADEKLGMPEISGKLVTAWNRLPEGYGMLSLNAINKINPFLKQGFIYTEAVLLANMPTVFGNYWNEENKKLITDRITELIDQNKKERHVYNIVNCLISKYKSLPEGQVFAYKDFEYRLAESDKKDVLNAIIDHFGEKKWNGLHEKDFYIDKVTQLYQNFFTNHKREFLAIPRVVDTISTFIIDNFPLLNQSQILKLYHPSLIDTYPEAPRAEDGKLYLQSPKTGSFKNPMAMRTLHQLRRLVNYLIKTNQIDEETRIVVELARELNDANKRWAIKTYQQQREAENKEFAIAIAEMKKVNPSALADASNVEDIDKVRLWFDQLENNPTLNKGKGEYGQHIWNNVSNDTIQKIYAIKDKDVEKYRLWSEQRCQCLYTGKVISLSDLFSENIIDFEHTLPRSKSFDNSLSNLTVCFADFNRNIKRNQIPAQLGNYDEILARIGLKRIVKNGEAEFEVLTGDNWAQKVEQIKQNIDFWRSESKRSTTKERKDQAIRQRHLWTLELEYWEKKVNSFKTQEITSGFKNSQLVDTQIISKYAVHYLKTVFNRVEVQKGNITAEFRKIYGIQPKDEKKDRSLHSHHAKDAAVLTLIPLAGERDSILESAYKYNETQWQQYHISPYKDFENEHITAIDNTILINNIAKDQALSPAKKQIKIKGKIRMASGDSIRGQLHQETFFGAIRLPLKDENGKTRIENGKFVYDDKITYVVREPFVYKKDASSAGFKSLEEIEEQVVDKQLFEMIKRQIDNRDFKTAMTEGIHLYDKNGKSAGKIRHVRIKVRSTEPLAIKEQTNISKKVSVNMPNSDHKKYYYVGNGENYAYALYQGIIKNKIERDFRIINLFDASKLIKVSEDKHLSIEANIEYNKKGDKLQLYAVLKIGQKVLFFKEHPDELKDISSIELSKRLYKILGFEKDGRIRFLLHIDSRDDKALKELESSYGKGIWQGFSSVNFEVPWPKLKLTVGNFNFLIENKDFAIAPDGQISFK